MKCKRLLKFYFYAESLNTALDRLITAVALKSQERAGGGEECAERIIEIIREKDELSRLWNYLDGVLKSFSESEIQILKFYGGLNSGLYSLNKETIKKIKTAAIKFSRRARFILRYENAVRLVLDYYCLLSPSS